MPRISVVVAAHNAERELPLLLRSLEASEFRDFEVCLCDDGSTDGTSAAAAEFSGRLALRAVRHAANRGVTAARNSALALASASLVLFVDADVRLYPDTIGKLASRLEAEGADVVAGIYSPIAIDGGWLAQYYALFVHHSFLGAPGPSPYNVFNAWCALCRREALAAVGGHEVVAKGVEIENEALGRRLVARGFKLILDPGIAVDHHWRGLRKLLFIFTNRVYWWVKVYFATGRRFETALTTPGYAAGTLCPALALASAALIPLYPAAAFATAAFAAGFLAGYGPFLGFVLRRRGPAFALLSSGLALLFSLPAAASAAVSGLEELARLALTGRTTLDPRSFA